MVRDFIEALMGMTLGIICVYGVIQAGTFFLHIQKTEQVFTDFGSGVTYCLVDMRDPQVSYKKCFE